MWRRMQTLRKRITTTVRTQSNYILNYTDSVVDSFFDLEWTCAMEAMVDDTGEYIIVFDTSFCKLPSSEAVEGIAPNKRKARTPRGNAAPIGGPRFFDDLSSIVAYTRWQTLKSYFLLCTVFSQCWVEQGRDPKGARRDHVARVFHHVAQVEPPVGRTRCA